MDWLADFVLKNGPALVTISPLLLADGSTSFMLHIVKSSDFVPRFGLVISDNIVKIPDSVAPVLGLDELSDLCKKIYFILTSINDYYNAVYIEPWLTGRGVYLRPANSYDSLVDAMEDAYFFKIKKVYHCLNDGLALPSYVL